MVCKFRAGLPVSAALTAFTIIGTTICASAADTKGQVVATVNGQKITRGEIFEELLADQIANLNATEPTFKGKNRVLAASIGALLSSKLGASAGKPVTFTKEEVLNFFFSDKQPVLYQTIDRVIQERAIMQAAKASGFTASEAEIASQTKTTLEGVKKNLPTLAGKSDSQTLVAMGFRPAYLRPFVTTKILLGKLAKKDMEKQLGRPIGNNDFVEASHILVRVNTDPQNAASNDKVWADGKTKIDAILADINSNKTTFEASATKNSDDGSKFRSGSLGIVPRGQMVAEFEKVIFNLPKGKVSEPFKTQFGWHIARVDRLGSEMTGPEKAQILASVLANRTKGKIAEIIKAAKIDNKYPMPVQAQPQQGMAPGQ